MKLLKTTILFFVVLLTLSVTSCEENEVTVACNVDNPVEELDWLREMIEESKDNTDLYFVMADYNGITVFYADGCHPATSYVLRIRNCEGEIIGDFSDLREGMSNFEIIWKHPFSNCKKDF